MKKILFAFLVMACLIFSSFSFAQQRTDNQNDARPFLNAVDAIDAVRNQARVVARDVFNDPAKSAARQRVIDARKTVAEEKRNLRDSFSELVTAREEFKNATAVRRTALKEELKEKTRRALLVHAIVLKKKLLELNESDTIFSVEEQVLDSEDASEEQIIDAAKQIREKWVEKKRDLKQRSAKAVNQRIRELNQKTINFVQRLENLIAKLNENNVDAAELQMALEAFKEHKNKFQEIYDRIQEEFENAVSPEEKDTAIKHAYRLLNAAHDTLMKDFVKIKRLVNKIRAEQNGNTFIEEPEPVQAENLGSVLEEVENDSGVVVEENVVDVLTATANEIEVEEEVTG